MLFGSPDKEHIQFNEQNLWTGDETQMGAYQPFGDLFLDAPVTNVSNYRRELDLSEAVQRTRFTSNGVNYLREAFSNHPDQVIVIRLSADKPGAISGSLRLTVAHQAPIVGSGNTLVSKGSLSNHLDYQTEVRVLNEKGSVTHSNKSLTIEKADSVTILLAASTSFFNSPEKNWRGEAPDKVVARVLEAASRKSYEALRTSHVADHQALFKRVAIDLCPSLDNLPTDQRIARNQNDNSDPGLSALFFQYGRYLLIASSRPGGLPANLQGIWN